MTFNEYQDSIYHKVISNLQIRNIIYVYGSVGTGKTSVVKRFTGNRMSLFSFSEICKEDESLFSWVTSSKATANKVANINTATNAILSFDKSECIKEPVKFVFSVFNKTLRTAKELNNVFNDYEISIIINLAKLTSKGEYYLIFDNCEYMNEASLIFLSKIFNTESVNKLFGNNLKVILVENTNSFESKVGALAEAKIKIEINDILFRDFIYEVLNERSFSSEDIRLLAAVTNKDFNLSKVLLDYFKENDIHSDIITKSSTEEVLTDIFNKMIETHLYERKKDINCLEIASVLGMIVNAYDLSELTHDEIERVKSSLDFGEKCGFISADLPDFSIVRFLHPIIKNLFYFKLQNKMSLHKEYGRILKKKYPTKHMIIMENLYRGSVSTTEILDEFCTHLVILALKRELSFFDFEKYLKKYILEKYQIFAKILYEILICYEGEKYEECLKKAENICPIDIADDFCKGVIKYIKARTLLVIGTTTDSFQQVRCLLVEATSVFLESEMYDIYFDAMTVLLNVYAYKLSDLNKAREVESLYLDAYRKIQLTADSSELKNSCVDFYRRTASLLDAQGAFERMKNLFNQNVLDDYLPKYKAYSDMVGYSLYAGEFQTAREYSILIRRYVRENSFYSFPEEYKYINNIVLSEIFNAELDTENFAMLVKSGIDRLKKYEDRSGVSKVVKMNLACLYILDMNYEEAERRLVELYAMLSTYSNALYFTAIPSNLASLCILKGDFESAQRFNKEAGSHLDKWDDNYRIYYKRQNEYMLDLIARQADVSPMDLFRPDDAGISAKTYQFVGRGIMMSELLFYTL